MDKHRLTVFDADRHDADYRTVLILDKVSGIPLVEEDSVVFDVPLIERVQKRMARAVGCCTSPRGLPSFTEIFRLAAKRTLVNPTVVGPRERQPHVLELKNGLRTLAAHVFNGILITDVV